MGVVYVDNPGLGRPQAFQVDGDQPTAEEWDRIKTYLVPAPSPAPAPVEEETGGGIGDFVQGTGRGFAGAFAQIPEGIAALGELATGNTPGTTSFGQSAGRLTDRAMAAVDEYLPAEDSGWAKAGQAVGSIGSFFVPAGLAVKGASLLGAGARLATAAGTTTAAIQGASLGASEQLARIEQRIAAGGDVSDEEIREAVGWGGAVGLTEAAPVGLIFGRSMRLLRALPPEAREQAILTLGKRLRNASTAALAEGGQEVFAGVMQDLIEQGYNPEAQVGQSFRDDAIYGGGAGAAMQALADTITGRKLNARSQLTDDLKAEAEAARAEVEAAQAARQKIEEDRAAREAGAQNRKDLRAPYQEQLFAEPDPEPDLDPAQDFLFAQPREKDRITQATREAAERAAATAEENAAALARAEQARKFRTPYDEAIAEEIRARDAALEADEGQVFRTGKSRTTLSSRRVYKKEAQEKYGWDKAVTEINTPAGKYVAFREEQGGSQIPARSWGLYKADEGIESAFYAGENLGDVKRKLAEMYDADPNVSYRRQVTDRIEQATEQTFTPEVTAKIPEVAKVLRARLDELGLQDVDLLLKKLLRPDDFKQGIVTEGYEYSPADGKRAIALSTEIYDPGLSEGDLTNRLLSTLNHEGLHSMRRLGIVSDRDMNTLVKAASNRKYINKQGKKRAYSYLGREIGRNNALPENMRADRDKVMEEAVAEMFRDAADGKFKIGGPPKGVIDRIMRIIKAIGTAGRSVNINQADQLFGKILTPKTQTAPETATEGATEGVEPDATQTAPEAGTATDVAVGEATTDLEQAKREAVKRIKEANPRQPEDISFARKKILESKDFKNWFADSKVVDSKGEPWTGWHHGYFNENEDIPSGPMHFGTEDAAYERAIGKFIDEAVEAVKPYQNEKGEWHWDDGSVTSEEMGHRPDKTRERALAHGREFALRDAQQNAMGHDIEDLGNLTAAFLNIKNPKRVEDQGRDWTRAIEQAKAEGHDGLVYVNRYEDNGSTSYIAFEPTQIKSINNQGTFSKEDPDIRFSRTVVSPEQKAMAKRLSAEDRRYYDYVAWLPKHFDNMGLTNEQVSAFAEAQIQFMKETSPEATKAFEADLDEQVEKIKAAAAADASTAGVSLDDMRKKIQGAYRKVNASTDLPLQRLAMGMMGDALSVQARDEKIADALYSGNDPSRGFVTSGGEVRPAREVRIGSRVETVGGGTLDYDYDGIGTWSLTENIARETAALFSRARKNPDISYSRRYSRPVKPNPSLTMTNLDKAGDGIMYGRFYDMVEKGLGYVMPKRAAETVSNEFVTKFQDQMVWVGKLMDDLRSKGATDMEILDVYRKEELLHGEQGNRIRLAEEELYEPVVETIGSVNLTSQQLDDLMNITGKYGEGYASKMVKRYREPDKSAVTRVVKKAFGFGKADRMAVADAYLYARHAQERNKYVSGITDGENKTGSGMSDTEAQDILNWVYSLPADQKAVFDRLGAQVDAIVENTNKTYIEFGLLDPNVVDVSEDTENDIITVTGKIFANYVPLRGKDGDLPSDMSGMASASPMTGVRGKENPNITGRVTGYAENSPLAEVMVQNQRAIVRGGRNDVARTFAELIRKNPDMLKDYEIVENVPSVKVKMKRLAGNKVGKVPDQRYADRQDVLPFKEDGKQKYIEGKDLRVIRGLKGATGAQNSMAIIRGLSSLNRWFASINTSWNPEFLMTNFARDIQTAGLNLTQYEMDGLRTEVLKGIPSSIKILKRFYRGGKGSKKAERFNSSNPQFESTNAEDIRMLEDFLADGGKNMTNMMSDTSGQEHEIRKVLSRISDLGVQGVDAEAAFLGTGLDKAKGLFKYISDYNDIVENTTRFSLYKALRGRGVSRDQAAQAARNLTTNFSKGGEWKTGMNAMYLFYNASLQGSIAMLNAALRSGKARQLWGGAIAMGFMMDQINAYLSDTDDDDKLVWDKTSNYTLEHNMILMDPFNVFSDRGYFTVPLPYGLNMAVNLGRVTSRVARRGYDADEAAGSVIGTVIETLNPLGDEESVYNLVAPTALDFPIDVLDNRDFKDDPIRKEPFPGDPSARSGIHWNSTSPVAINTAKWLNKVTGGTAVEPGWVDLSPDMIEHFIGQMTGGAGATLLRVAELPETITEFEEEKVRQVPFARRLYGSATLRSDTGNFIETFKQVRLAKLELDDAKDKRDSDRVASAKKRHAEALRVYPKVNTINNARGKLIRQRNTIIDNSRLSDKEKDRRLKAIDEKIERLVARGNKLMEGIENVLPEEIARLCLERPVPRLILCWFSVATCTALTFRYQSWCAWSHGRRDMSPRCSAFADWIDRHEPGHCEKQAQRYSSETKGVIQ